MTWEVLEGDALDLLVPLEDVQTVVTSPPYWGLRDYGLPAREWPDGWRGCIGLEPTPEMYVEHLVAVFREVWSALRDDGTLWLNLGDSFNAYNGNRGNSQGASASVDTARPRMPGGAGLLAPNLKQKDLVGIPWRVAFALQADGWYLRSDIVWSKPQPMPESIKDRPTRAHEFIFLLSKQPRYYYDSEAIRERDGGRSSGNGFSRPEQISKGGRGQNGEWTPGRGRNRRSVWEVASEPFPEAHFATFPPKLIEPCILAGAGEGGLVLDPFSGAGTTGVVAKRLGRHYVGCELNPAYVEMSRRRINATTPPLLPTQPTLPVDPVQMDLSPTEGEA